MLELNLVLGIAAGALVIGLVVGFSIRAYVSARRHRRARARRELPTISGPEVSPGFTPPRKQS